MTLHDGDEYVALGSSYAAGPGLPQRVHGSPLLAARSARNYAHLVASARRLRLRDVTFSGATTVEILGRGLGGEPPQVRAVGAATRLVTITCGGNDVGYIPGLATATLPRVFRWLPRVQKREALLLDPERAERSLDEVRVSLGELARELRRRAPEALILFVDYLTVLPPDADTSTPPLPPEVAELGRHIAARLSELTREAAEAEGCDFIAASRASVDHHAWSTDPWTNTNRFRSGEGAPWHPKPKGMRAVADLVLSRLDAAPA